MVVRKGLIVTGTVVLLCASGCSDSYDSVDDLVEATGCVDLHDDNPEGLGDTIRCQREEDRADLYLEYFNDEDDREQSLSLQRLTNERSGGTGKIYVVFDDHWIITCFDESVCREISEDLDGSYEELN